MPSPHVSSSVDSRRALVVISAGLSILVAAQFLTAVPTVTAMALVAWGATLLTSERFRGAPALPLVMVAHLATYGMLYVLFVGASLHAAAGSPGGIWAVTTCDVAVSIGPLMAATRRAVEVLTSRPSAG